MIKMHAQEYLREYPLMSDTNFFRSPTAYEPVSDTPSYGVELAFGGKVYQLFSSDGSASSDSVLLSGQRHLCHEPLSVFFQEFRKSVLGPHFGLAAHKHQMVLGLEGLSDPLISETEAENDDCTLWEFWEQAVQPTLRFEMHIQVTPIDNMRQSLSSAVKGGAVKTLEAVKESITLDLVDVDEDALSDDDIQRFLSELMRRERDAQMTKETPEEDHHSSPVSSPLSSPQESTISVSSSEDKGLWIYRNSKYNHLDEVIDWEYEIGDRDPKVITSGSSPKRKHSDGYDGDLSDNDSDYGDFICESPKKARMEH
ncbi:hypothetical protein BGZ59_002662 [Podila verticillata]|nr:hypothetical protein BGZ59_002662 [Podila verticillata]KAI9242329.1 MAG: hypothetical protein BYD32DRAFT_432437 [Podila humilis]KFH72098.1 hypothetical protein MVEG_02391 [Podila verticillata NRRL 6337]